jgi:pyruvate/2-oxoglutarate dehydrogenase complex dihydrolipoamide dehydrogenase (E3) component
LDEPSSLKLDNGTIVSPDLTLIATGRKPNVFTIGDINGLALLDSVAFAQARVSVETILGKSAGFNLRWVPRCVHTDPPVASAGGLRKRLLPLGITSKCWKKQYGW